MKYQRFSATYGYDILITHLETNQTFLGQELQHKSTHRIDGNIKYTIICDPTNIASIKFNYLGGPLTAGELGLWCSNIGVWHDIVKNEYKSAIIFEDDIYPKNIVYVKQQLEDFTSNLPKSFDLGYLYYIHYLPNSLLPQSNLINNPYCKKFDSSFEARGTQAIVYSNKAAKTLLSYETYTGSIDGFLWGITLNEDYTHQEFPKLTQGLLEIYTSSLELIGTDFSESILAEMRT